MKRLAATNVVRIERAGGTVHLKVEGLDPMGGLDRLAPHKQGQGPNTHFAKTVT